MVRWEPDARGRLQQAALELYGERGLPTRTAIGCHGIFGDFPLEIVVTVLFSGPTVRPSLPRDGRPSL